MKCFGKFEESTLHALWECDVIHSIWGPKFNDLRRDFTQLSSFSNLVSVVEQQQKNLELFTVVAWFIGIGGINVNLRSLVSPLRRFFRQHRIY